MNTKRAIEVLQSPASGFPNAFSATEHLEANALGAAALEREEKLREWVKARNQSPGEACPSCCHFEDATAEIESILDGRAP